MLGIAPEGTIQSILRGGVVRDLFFSNVVLLLGFEGANGSTGAPGMNDESPTLKGTATVSAPFAITTAQFKFGAASLGCSGSGRLAFADGADWNFGAGNFTVEAWIYPASIAPGPYHIVGKWNTAGQFGWRLSQNAAGTGIAWDVSVDGTATITDLSGGTLTANTWTHAAVDYNGVKYRLYVGGVMVASSTTARNIFSPSILLTIGAGPVLQFPFGGGIDELRITKGVARYATDTSFTVPTAAFPRS